MKRKIMAILLVSFMALMLLPAGSLTGAAAQTPSITGIHVIDTNAKLIEILFSEPVRFSNLGYVLGVNQYPNGDNAWCNLEWNAQYDYYGAVDSAGNRTGADGYVRTTGDQSDIFGTRFVATLGTLDGINAMLFTGLNGAGAIITPDGRTIKGNEANELYIPFTAAVYPTVTGAKVLDETAQKIEITFSEPVNVKNLGWIIPVNQYPNGDHPYAGLEWNGEYDYYGSVDYKGNPIGESGYVRATGDQTTIFATRLVVTVGTVQNGGTFNDLNGIEFQNMSAGMFHTADGRMVKGDESGKLYVTLTHIQSPETDPETNPETIPETTPETIPETTPETTPEASGTVSTKDAPTITGIHVLNASEALIEITFSEPVNIKNLGYIIPVHQFPNADNPWANLEWNGQYHYYGCVDVNGEPIGDSENHIMCDGDNDYIYATRMVVNIGAVQNGGTFADINGIEFKSLSSAGKISTPDGRCVQGNDGDSLYVAFTKAPATFDSFTLVILAGVAAILTVPVLIYSKKKNRI